MCNNRKQIYTNAHKIWRNRYTPYELSIPCGECSECQQDRQNEWTLRTYYQYLECVSNGGYAIWDCLTYRNDTLPHLNEIEQHVPDKYNFKCFRKEDVQLWLKRLRSNLSDKGYETKENIKYLIAGEYGQEEDYTLRPHYHVILYINCDIDPIEMSMEIKRAWGKGRTYGIEDKGYQEFNDKGLITTKARALRVANYIGKYCLKNQEYDKVADTKIKLLCKFWYDVENNADIEEKALFKKPEWKAKKKEILRKVKTFHIQSKGYGKYALECNCIKDNLIGMPNAKKIYWYQKLPMYFVRKLYYDYIREGKKIIWYLTDVGKQWKLKNIDKVIDGYAKKLQEKETFVQSNEFRLMIYDYMQNELNIHDDSRYYYLNDLLYAYKDGRPWKDYAEYIIYHKGRIWDGNIIKPQWSTILNAQAAAQAEYLAQPEELYYNYCHEKDIEHFKKQIVSPRNMGNEDEGWKTPIGDELKPAQFSKIYCINENSNYIWRDFDKLTDVLATIDSYIEYQKMKHLKLKRKHESLKAIGFYKL